MKETEYRYNLYALRYNGKDEEKKKDSKIQASIKDNNSSATCCKEEGSCKEKIKETMKKASTEQATLEQIDCFKASECKKMDNVSRLVYTLADALSFEEKYETKLLFMQVMQEQIDRYLHELDIRKIPVATFSEEPSD